MMSEKIELLGKGIYKNIPDELTLSAFPTVTELDYVGSEDFEKTMLDDIFPKCIEEKIDFRQLLEMDFQWICRGLRFLNYGPYFTTNAIICDTCGPVRMDCSVDLRNVNCKPLPANFSADIVIKKDELIDYNKDIHLHLLTIQEVLNLRNDKMFKKKDDRAINTHYARICYSISAFGNDKDVTPVSAKLEIESKMTPADFKVLDAKVAELTDYGLRGGGRCICPNCGSKEAAFIALPDDKFFRPTVGDIKKGRNARNIRGTEDTAGSSTKTV